ncbi:hypothetical protein F4678DRAFT_165193 [Xylaria arbuscula]|nr:hypothetical protein F4678DRAFT_165193 [Xylaria arbuscula]
MALPSHLAQSLNDRRPMDITDSEASYSSTNNYRIRNTIRHSITHDAERRSSSQLQRLIIPPTPSSLDPNFSSQPLTVRTGHSTDYSSGFGLQQSRNTLGNMSAGAQGAMTTPKIVIENYNQEQSGLSGSSLQHGGQHFYDSTLRTLNQFGTGTGSRRNSAQSQAPSNSSCLESLVSVEYILPLSARKGKLPNSCIYEDVIPRIIQDAGRQPHVHPSWPPFHQTLTREGYDSRGGKFIQMTLRNRMRQDVPLPLAIISRDLPMDERDGMDVDIVLGQDYAERLNDLQGRPMGLQRQMDGPQFLSLNWQLAGRSQNGPLSSESSAFAPGHLNFSPGGWPPASNHAQMLQPPYPAGPYSSTTLPSSQGSSNLVPSSATSLDGIYAPTPYHRV